MASTDLSEKMLARAEADKLPAAHPLRVNAAEFDTATKGFFAEPQIVPVAAFMGAWARARKAWCQYTGEPLL